MIIDQNKQKSSDKILKSNPEVPTFLSHFTSKYVSINREIMDKWNDLFYKQVGFFLYDVELCKNRLPVVNYQQDCYKLNFQ